MKVKMSAREFFEKNADRVSIALNEAVDSDREENEVLSEYLFREYEAQLRERGVDVNPYMILLDASVQEDGSKQEIIPGFFYPRWFAPANEGDSEVGVDSNPIEAPFLGADYMCEDLENAISELQVWQRLLAWSRESDLRAFREKHKDFLDDIPGLEDFLEDPIDDSGSKH